MAEPSVTIVVLAYNHENYVDKALDGAFSQTYQHCSVIIFDDASSDGSAGRVRDYLELRGDPSIFVQHEVNRGLCATLNEALTYVETEYVVFISADDWMEDNRIELQVGTLHSLGATYAAAYSDAKIVDQSGHSDDRTFIKKYLGQIEPPQGEIFMQLLRGNWIPAPAAMIRTNVFSEVGIYDEDLPYEDYDMWLRISRRFKIAYVPGNLVNYREVSGSLTDVVFRGNERTAHNAKIRIYGKHWGISKEADEVIIGHLSFPLVNKYLEGSNEAEVRAGLRNILWKTGNPKILSYVLLAGLRIPGSWIRALKFRVGRV